MAIPITTRALKRVLITMQDFIDSLIILSHGVYTTETLKSASMHLCIEDNFKPKQLVVVLLVLVSFSQSCNQHHELF